MVIYTIEIEDGVRVGGRACSNTPPTENERQLVKEIAEFASKRANELWGRMTFVTWEKDNEKL